MLPRRVSAKRSAARPEYMETPLPATNDPRSLQGRRGEMPLGEKK
jgi:hypothetical protein